MKIDTGQALSLERTYDLELVRSLATHPRVWEGITDDDCPPREEWRPSENPSVVYLLALIGADPVGYWMLVPHASYLWECHTVLTPAAWGLIARELADAAIRWVWHNTPARRIITHVPEYNRVALRFALVNGFVEYGRNPNSFMKHGKTWTVIELGIDKPCQQP